MHFANAVKHRFKCRILQNLQWIGMLAALCASTLASASAGESTPAQLLVSQFDHRAIVDSNQPARASWVARQPFKQLTQSSTPRDRFIEEYQRYQDQVKPKLLELNLKDWAPLDLESIIGQVDSAKAQFQEGDYQQAYDHLKDVSERVGAMRTEYAIRLSEFVENARLAYREGRASEAEQHIAGGLLMDPNHAELLALESRVKVFGEVNRLLTQANQAKAANRKNQELEFLEAIVHLDPRHLEAQKRIEILRAERLHQAYSEAVSAADRALDNGDIEQAKKHLQRANRIKPKNKDTPRLQARISGIEAEQRYFQQITSAVLASREDDWQAAVKHYQQALKIRQFDQLAMEGLRTAESMAGMIQSLQRALEHERRFANEYSIKTTRKLLATTEPFLEQSEQLKFLHNEIIEKMQLYNLETEVIVVSDNETDVVVKGIGIVGRTLRYSIRLKPGAYQFEGTRKNYKSTIVPITISPGDGPIEVKVICSERI